MKRLPDFDAWAIFATVAREGSFAKAAEVLGLSQATVSKAITRLETRTETMLFHRTSRRITLTESGRRVLENANDLLNMGEVVEANMSEQSEAMRGVIRISSPMSFGLNYLSPILPSFLEQHPSVELDINFDDRQVDLVAEGFDFSLRIADLADSSLLAQRVCSIRMLLVGAPAYFDKYGTPQHPSDLAQHNALLYTYAPRTGHWRFKHATEGEHNQALPNSRLRANNGDALLPALKQGLGLAIIPEFLAWPERQSGEVIEVLPEWNIAPTALYIVTPPGRLRPTRVTALIEYLMQALRVLPWSDGTS